MKPEFHEDFVSDQRDPMDARSVDFPWEEVFARLDKEAVTDEAMALSIALLGEVLRWLMRGCGEQRLFLRGNLAGRRAVALAWVIRPDLFEGVPSIRALAERIGVPRQALSRHASEIAKRWGVFNRAQAPHHKATSRTPPHPSHAPQSAPPRHPGTQPGLPKAKHQPRTQGRGQGTPLPSPGKESFNRPRARGWVVTPQNTQTPPKRNVP